MVTGLLALFFSLAALTLVMSLVLTLHTWEHRRYARSCFQNRATARTAGRVAVIVPCKGVDFSLKDNLHRLLVQDYEDYEVHFVVEAADDPACRVIQKLIAGKPEVAVQLIVAGCALDCGQKIHNLSVATTRLDEAIKTLVFVDSDAAPESDWLSRLIAPLDAINVNAVTSYRWFVPRRTTLGNLLISSINATAMGLVCSRRQSVLWGGSWAVSREVFERADIRGSWRGQLSDDLVASHRMDRLRLNINFEPSCVVTSSIDYQGMGMWEFLRRQCYVGRWYRTKHWLLSLVFTSASMSVFWGGLLLSIVLFKLASPLVAGLALGGSSALWGLAVVRATWRQDAGRLFVRRQNAELERARIFDLCAYPLVLSVAWLGLLSAVVGRSVWWRGIGYRMQKGGKLVLLAKEPHSTTDQQPFLLEKWLPVPTLAMGDEEPAIIVLPGNNTVQADVAEQRRSA
jgi:ceramide glucosyltransferase